MKNLFTFPNINKGEPISISYNQERFINEVIIGNEYDFVFNDLVVVDIGANIGTFSLWIYDRAKKIYAIEPVKEVLDCLNETIKDNNLTKIKTYQLAIGGKTYLGTMKKEAGDPHLGGWCIDTQGEYPVEIMSLGGFFEKEGIEYADIVKIDVEGVEESILLADDFPKDKISTIIGENHHSGRSLKPALDEIGFEYFEYPNNHFMGRKRR